MNEGAIIKKIKANCPRCLAGCDDIKYRNSGPVVVIYCTKCGFVCHDYDARRTIMNTKKNSTTSAVKFVYREDQKITHLVRDFLDTLGISPIYRGVVARKMSEYLLNSSGRKGEDPEPKGWSIL